MNKLLSVLLVAATTSASAAAQQVSKDVAAATTTRATLLAQEGQAVHHTPGSKLAREFPQTRIPTEQRRVELPLGDIVLLPPQWVWKEGALYLDLGLFGNEMLIPVPGGVASGCFGPNLPTPVKTVGTNLGAFPSRPLPVTSPRH